MALDPLSLLRELGHHLLHAATTCPMGEIWVPGRGCICWEDGASPPRWVTGWRAHLLGRAQNVCKVLRWVSSKNQKAAWALLQSSGVPARQSAHV